MQHNTHTKVGILGGGQLGKMLAIAAANWHLPVHVLDKSTDYPAGPMASSFTIGDFNDYDDVYRFGKTVDVLTIEIEHVNTAALAALAAEGVIVHPRPAALDIIKDKGLQKQFYAQHQLPTAPYRLFDDAEQVRAALRDGLLDYPFVQKLRTDGYDGRGVAVLRSAADLGKLLPGASVVEDLVDIHQEIAVIVARRSSGEVVAYPPVEMDFNPEANLVEWLLCPAGISDAVAQEALVLAIRTIEAFDICGLLAVELFLTPDGQLLVNEVAPRPHNSGHHTIEACYTSQFEQHLRAILDFPLGSTHLKAPAVMLNVLGAPGHEGPAHYEGLAQCLALEGVQLHLYGKALTKPFRKMGHVTVIASDIETAKAQARQVKAALRCVTR